MNEVSCRALGIHFAYLDAHEIPLEAHFEGIPYSIEHLRNPENRLDWAPFVTLSQRLSVVVGGEAGLVNLGHEFMRTHSHFLPLLVGKLIASPNQFLFWNQRFGHRLLFNHMHSEMRELPDRSIELIVVIPKPYEPCLEYYYLSKGALESMPTFFGFPASKVALSTDGSWGRFHIVSPQHTTVFGRVRQLGTRAWALKQAVGELEKSNTLLQERFDLLSAAERKLAKQATHLEAVNGIGRLLSTELDLTRLAEVIVSVSREWVGAAFVRLEVQDEEGVVQVARESGGRPDHLETLPLVNLGRRVGSLETDRAVLAAGGEQATLLRDLTPWYAAALENALPHRRQKQSQEELGRKVEARTAELSAAYDKLKAYDDARSEFFSNVSHELRTPLSLILAPAEAMLEGSRGELTSEARTEVETIHQAANRLHSLTTELLDHARLEAGRLPLRREVIHAGELVEELAGSLRAAAQKAKLTLAASGTAEPIFLEGDRERLFQALLNLAVNALKFTPAGGKVTLAVTADKEQVRFAVSDTGIGIDPGDLARLFERFAQADAGQTRRLAGTGLGLSLVKKLTELHGGQVSVVSVRGTGSTFTMTLARCARPTVATRSVERSSLQGMLPGTDSHEVRDLLLDLEEGLEEPGPRLPPGKGASRVLLVEDHPALRAYLLRELASRYQVASASDGEQGLALAKSFRPDVVVSDVMLPLISGVELCRRLRDDPQTSAVPVILLTARRHLEHKLEGLAAGAVDYLVKPFAPRELLARVDVQLSLRAMSVRLANAERLSGLGMLAAGFAHEARNPLNGIINATRPLRKLIARGSTADAVELVAVIEECGGRLAHLSESVLDLARAPGPNREEVDVGRTLEAALTLLEHRTRGVITVQRDFGAKKPTVPGDPGALGQVWLNLIDNAIRAMPGGGTLSVQARESEGALLVAVRDTGGGIAEADRARLFDPFFTTRGAGEGTGLGLSLSRQIVERHGGELRLGETSASGTVFEVRLPLGRS